MGGLQKVVFAVGLEEGLTSLEGLEDTPHRRLEHRDDWVLVG